MPGILEPSRPQWGDLEHGRHSPSKRKDVHRRPRLPARKSTIIGFIVCFLFVVIVMRRFFQIQLDMPNDRLHALDSKRNNKFAIVTFETRDVTYWRQSLGNKCDYSRRHGYDFIPYFQPLKNDDKGGVWAKIVVVYETLNSGLYEWVLWKDFDTLFTNTSIRIEDFMEDVKINHLNSFDTGQQWKDVDMIVTRDCQKFNAGVMFFRNSAWTREYLKTIWSRRMETGVSEQDVLRDTLEKMGEFGEGNKHLLSVSQFRLNSYPVEIGCHENFDRPWQPGDWIIHFAGSWASLEMKDSKDPFGDMLRRYYPRIVDS